MNCKPYEIMKITQTAHRGVVQRNKDIRLVLAGLRRNGQLGYRPNLNTGRLEKVEMQEGSWAEHLKEASHRYPASFLVDRYDWLDSAGRPIPVDWRRANPQFTDVQVKKAAGPVPQKLHLPVSEAAAKADAQEKEIFPKQPSADDFARLSYSIHDSEILLKQKMNFAGKEIDLPVLAFDFGDHEICSDEIAKLVQQTPKERRMQRKIDPELVKSALRSRKKDISSKIMIRRALSSFSQEMHDGLQLDLKKMTRSEVMQKLVTTGASKRKGDSAKKNDSRRRAP